MKTTNENSESRQLRQEMESREQRRIYRIAKAKSDAYELAALRAENEKLRAALKLVWDGCQQRGFSPTENETAMVLSALAKEVK